MTTRPHHSLMLALSTRSTSAAWRALPALIALIVMSGVAAGASDLGSVDFPTSGSPEAQERFLRGVLLLHSFEYEDAREEFQKAQEVEQDFAMGYWGEAMTHNKPLWMRLDQAEGQAVLKRLGKTKQARLAKAPTEREKGFLAAVDVLFFGEGDKAARDEAYAESMRELAQRFPNDQEAAAFHALAVLGTAQGERDFGIYMQAGAIASRVFEKNPQHPGAAHYVIHSFDDPIHAPLGLPAARSYAKIAPSAAHALHMPSHIFVALGMWDETASSNEDSWAAADARVKRKGLTIEDRSYHALLWLHYTYLQQRRYKEARRLLDIMEADVKQLSVGLTRRHLAAMRAHHVVETRQWDAVALGDDFDWKSVRDEDAVAYLFARGVSALHRGEIATAEKALAKIGERRSSKNQSGYSSEERVVRATYAQLEALIALERGNEETAVTLLADSASEQDAMPLAYGPPTPVKPSHELFGEVLLELKQPRKAQTHFEKALEQAPRRALSLWGLARAATQAGDEATAERAYRDLRAVWHRADGDLPPDVR